MSHFTVMVRVEEGANVGARLKELLAPYEEYDCVKKPAMDMQFDRATEAREAYESGALGVWVLPTADDPFGDPYYRDENHQSKRREGAVQVPYNKRYATLQEFMEDWHGYEYSPEHDDWGSWHNSKAKWDWWVEGGRWEGKIPVGDQDRNRARIDEINMERVEAKIEADLEGHWRAYKKLLEERQFSGGPFDEFRSRMFRLGFVTGVAVDAPTPDHPHFTIPHRFGGQHAVRTDLADRREEIDPMLRAFLDPLRTYAYLDGEGGWIGPGRMGWWACTDETPESTQKYVKGFRAWLEGGNQRDTVVVVDCHI